MKNVYILCGRPASGKSTWAENERAKNPEHAIRCSRDEVRFSKLADGEEYFSHEREVLRDWWYSVRAALINDKYEDIYIDATHMTRGSRERTIKMCGLVACKYNIYPVVFSTNVEECVKRNAKRTGRACVPESVIRNTAFEDITSDEVETCGYKNIIYVK